jgi:hypothetical protein
VCFFQLKDLLSQETININNRVLNNVVNESVLKQFQQKRKEMKYQFLFFIFNPDVIVLAIQDHL